jgi:hypothetical protein
MKQFHRAASDESVCNGRSKINRGGPNRRTLHHLRHLLTIPRNDHPMQVPLLVRKVAIGPER